MDTLGSLIDKLFTADMKMWDNQEILYKIRRMSFQEYKKEYFNSEEGAKKLWDSLKKVCDLNIQRNNLIDEIDEKIIEMITKITTSKEKENLDHYIQKKYKTY